MNYGTVLQPPNRWRVVILTCMAVVICAGLVVLYEFFDASELAELRSPDGSAAISFRSHPDGMTRVSVSRKGRTDYLYTADNDSCSAPKDPRVIWSTDGKEAAIFLCDAPCGGSGVARLYDEASRRAMRWSEGKERIVALILQKYPPRSQKEGDAMRLNTYDWVCRNVSSPS